MPVADLDLSVRASNCLESAKLNTVADLVIQAEGGAFDGSGSQLVTGFWEVHQAVQTLP